MHLQNIEHAFSTNNILRNRKNVHLERYCIYGDCIYEGLTVISLLIFALFFADISIFSNFCKTLPFCRYFGVLNKPTLGSNKLSFGSNKLIFGLNFIFESNKLILDQINLIWFK